MSTVFLNSDVTEDKISGIAKQRGLAAVKIIPLLGQWWNQLSGAQTVFIQENPQMAEMVSLIRAEVPQAVLYVYNRALAVSPIPLPVASVLPRSDFKTFSIDPAYVIFNNNYTSRLLTPDGNINEDFWADVTVDGHRWTLTQKPTYPPLPGEGEEEEGTPVSANYAIVNDDNTQYPFDILHIKGDGKSIPDYNDSPAEAQQFGDLKGRDGIVLRIPKGVNLREIFNIQRYFNGLDFCSLFDVFHKMEVITFPDMTQAFLIRDSAESS